MRATVRRPSSPDRAAETLQELDGARALRFLDLGEPRLDISAFTSLTRLDGLGRGQPCGIDPQAFQRVLHGFQALGREGSLDKIVEPK